VTLAIGAPSAFLIDRSIAMSHHKKSEPQANQPADWDRSQMRPDSEDGPETPAGGSPDRPDWNEGQMARQRPDGTRADGPTDEEIEASQHGLSGKGANPGGGEQWADRDVNRK
jgi:hypothetical protein